jgi:hypothetical protein
VSSGTPFRGRDDCLAQPEGRSMGSWRTLPPWPRARGDVFDHHQRDR